MQSLTDRQLECLRLTATMTDKEIARHLDLSPHTVSLHVREANRRLGVGDRRAARRALAEHPLYGRSAMAEPAAEQPDRDVAANPPMAREDGQPTRRSLYDRYVDLGRWRTPPRIGGSRLPVIILWALLWLGMAAALAMVASVFNTIGQLR